jgi:hypothetical protein
MYFNKKGGYPAFSRLLLPLHPGIHLRTVRVGSINTGGFIFRLVGAVIFFLGWKVTRFVLLFPHRIFVVYLPRVRTGPVAVAAGHGQPYHRNE